MPTNVKLQDDTWTRLNRRKTPGDTFDDVVTAILDGEEPSTETDQRYTNTR